MYFILSLLIGNVVMLMVMLWPWSVEHLQWDMFNSLFSFLFITTIFSLPLLMPCLLFYFTLECFKTSAAQRKISGSFFGLFLSIGWSLVLTHSLNQSTNLDDLIFFLPFIFSAILSAPLTEYFFHHKILRFTGNGIDGRPI